MASSNHISVPRAHQARTGASGPPTVESSCSSFPRARNGISSGSSRKINRPMTIRASSVRVTRSLVTSCINYSRAKRLMYLVRWRGPVRRTTTVTMVMTRLWRMSKVQIKAQHITGGGSGGAGAGATGGDVRQEGETSREGGADGGRA